MEEYQMKQGRSFFLLLILFFACVLNPSTFASPISIGLQGGMNLGNLSFNPSRSTSTRTGIAIGGHLELSLLGIVYLQPELMYVQKGAVDSTTSNIIKLDYLEIPLLMKFKLGITPIHLELMAGPYVAFAMSTKTDLGASGVRTDLTDAKQMDVGAVLGVGAELTVGSSTSVFANLRYEMGFTNTSDTAGLTRRNNGVLLLGGLRFDLL
jgi:Outer membrane protein beta-barrel domain